MKDIDEAAARLAAKQHGAFTWEQTGAARRARDRRVAAGRWTRTERSGVYALAGYPRSWLQRLMVAILGAPLGTVASHRAAAVLHGLREGTPIEMTAPSGAHDRPAFGVVHYGTVPGSVTISGIPATRVERTLVDLAAVVSDNEVELAVEAALRKGLTTVERVAAQLGSPRPGVARLRKVLDRRGPGRPTGSELEVLFLQVLRAAGVPDPVRQFEVRVGGERYFLDISYPDRRLFIELDGRETHEGAAAFQRDRTKQNDLVVLGWTVLRFTWEDVTERPDAVVAIMFQMVAA